MDTSDSNIRFDADGVCNHCHAYNEANRLSENEINNFHLKLQQIKQWKGKYNCIIGVSGGLDSTYLLIHAVQDLKLNPLAVHVDNGWNTGLANQNISDMCSRLHVDLHTTVLNWEEFRKMQIAVLEAGVPDLEAPTDLFINYTLRRVSKKYDIPFVLSGTNPQTEGVMGSNWSYGQRDPIYLKDLYHRCWGQHPDKLPFKNWYIALGEQLTGKLEIVRPLKFTKYGKKLALERSVREVGWREYPRKHGESFITRFYQDSFLPRRFEFDKRRAHLSALVLNDDLRRDQALDILNSNQEVDRQYLADVRFICTKLRISEEQFERYMSQPKRFHDSFKSIKTTYFFRFGKSIKNILASNNRFVKFVERLVQY